jgi:RNA polymerase sigma factor (sigma-70 family)
MSTDEDKDDLPRVGQFATTHWSVVLAAGQTESPQAGTALEQLCRVYWYPLYAYVRRQGNTPQDAEDLTQEFFARFLESQALRAVSPERGRFRSLLLASLNHFLTNEWKRAGTLKRGGGLSFLSLDQAAAEDRYRLEPVNDLTPENIFERRWALTLLDQVLTRLRNECATDGKAELFDQLRGFLSNTSDPGSYAEVAAQIGTSEPAARQAVRRLRQRYRELMRAEIAQTVSGGFRYDFKMPFTPRGMYSITPFTHGEDAAAPVGAGGVRVGKFTHPSAALSNDLLVVWTPGPANDLNRPTTQPYYDAGLYLIRGGNVVTNPSQLVRIKNDSAYNEAWPRAVVSWRAVHGSDEPTRRPWLPNDGSAHTELPRGTPHGLIGTSSFYKRESFPGRVTQWSDTFDGLDSFNTTENEQSSNWSYQGSDSGKYSNADIWAVRIVAL